MAQARLQLPSSVQSGQLVRARLLIQHPMDTGFFQDLSGKPIPRNIITELRCDYAGHTVFMAQPSTGIASNPLFEFYFKAIESGEVWIRWIDDAGQAGQLRQVLMVEPAAGKS